MSRAQRRALVEREAPRLPIVQQCRLLAVSRAWVYRKPAEVSAEDLAIMVLIDRQYLVRPYYGSRRMAAGDPRPRRKSQTSAATDAAARAGGDLPAPEHQHVGGSAQDLSVPPRRDDDRAG